MTHVTVRHLVKDHLADGVESADHHLCMTEDCDVVYFRPASGVIYGRTDLTVPVWFKTGADPQYICYCSKVTYQQVRLAVMESGAVSIRDVARLTGAMNSIQCVRRNPTGRCCAPVIQGVIDEAKHGFDCVGKGKRASGRI